MVELEQSRLFSDKRYYVFSDNRNGLNLKQSILSLIILFLCCIYSMEPAASTPTDYDMTFSISESKKRGRYLNEVTVTPNNFKWLNHFVSISECWLEKTPKGSEFIIFRVLIDGKDNLAHKIFHKEKKLISFENNDKVSEVKNTAYFPHLNLNRTIKACFGGAYSEYVEYITLNTIPEKPFRLEVVTYTQEQKGPGHNEPTGTYLTFSINK